MKILIFAGEKSLLEYLEAKGKEAAVLDFTGSKSIKAAAGIVEPLSVFSDEEKNRAMAQYIEAISQLAADNEFSLQWLCHPISEKNDLRPDNLFNRLKDFLIFYRILMMQKRETLLILPHQPALARDIETFSARQGIDCRLMGSKPWKKSLIKRLKTWAKKQVSILQGVINLQRRYLKSRYLLKKIHRTETYIVIRTWYDLRSLSLLEKNEDTYFGRFPRYLKERGKEVLFFGDFSYGFHHILSQLKKDYEIPVVLTQSLLNGLDFFKSTRFSRRITKKVRLKSGITILDVNVDFIINRYFMDFAQDELIRFNYLYYLATEKLMKYIDVDVFYLPFENYAWEKLTWRAVKRYSPNTKIVAFQHAQVALNATKFYLGKEERSALLPDRIVTLGDTTRQILIERCKYPPEKLVTGCALRHDYTLGTQPRKRSGNKNVLVQLWSVPKSIEMINFLHASQVHPQHYRLTLNPHPNNPMKVLIPHLDFKYNNDFPLAKGALLENFQKHDVVIYHGTTTSLDALAYGLPVIELVFSDFITVDPLFAFNDFKWTVKGPGKLGETIDEIFALSDDEYYRRQQKGFAFVKDYFYPVNDENMEKFLI